ncbi:hypothetical protein CVU37_05910 [candidate division BRC1 bacterium HGW-BRC1-1]|nr:MAG: hypothetical protein CVU37_05910 [candidate division BRC1 bacterium HGW-BRC1-1]
MNRNKAGNATRKPRRGEQVYTLSGADRVYRQLVETMSEGALTLSPDGVILYCNVRLAEMLGQPLDQILGRALRDYIPPADQQELDAILSQQATAPGRREINLKTGEGRVVPVYLSASRMQSEGAELVFFLVLTDLTEQKDHEQIAAAERLARLILEQAVAAIVVCDEQGRILRASQAAQRFCTGRPFLRPFAEMFPLRTDTSDPFHLAPVLQGETLRNADVTLELQGQEFHFILNAGPLLSGEQLVGCVVTLTDITERRRAQESLRAGEHEFRSLAEAMPQIVWATRADGWNIYFNQQWVDYTGLTLEESYGHGWNIPFHPDDRQRAWDAWQNATQNNETYALECRLRGADDTYRWWLIRGVPMCNASGEILKWFGTCTDIEEIKLTEEALKERSAFLNTLLSAIPVPIFYKDSAGHYLGINKAFEEFFGKPRDQLLGTSVFDLSPHDLAQVYHAKDTELLQNRGTQVYESQVEDASGALHDVVFHKAPFTDGDDNVLGLIGVILDITERKKAEERTFEHVQRLTALHNVEMAVASSLDLGVTLNILLSQIRTSLEVDAVQVLLWDTITNKLVFRASAGFRTEAFKHTRLRFGEGLAGRVMLERRIIHLPDLAREAGSLWAAPLFSQEDFKGYYGVPMVAKGEVVGVLELFHRTAIGRDSEWMEILKMLAQEAAIAIDNAQLFEQLQRSNTELSVAYDSTLEGWALAIDMRDHETHGHSIRVADMTVRLARAVGVSDSDQVHIRRGALLHDIGKLGVPDSVLLKPGPLTDDEWIIMRKHPVLAHEMLSSIRFLRTALDIPHFHHEKWDGTGYPEGLAGTSIPLAARIFAVVDVWDALGSDRPYRKAWEREKIITHIQALAGTHFDPHVVDTFLSMEQAQPDLLAPHQD